MGWKLLPVLSLVLFSVSWLPSLQAQAGPVSPTLVSGEVENTDGAPVISAVVRIQDWGGNTVGTAETDTQGRYRVLVNSGGPFRVEVSYDGVTQTENLTDGQMNHYLIRLRTPQVRKAASAPTVSVNDLEAPKKAKSLYAKANHELGKLHLGKALDLINEAIHIAPNWGRPYVIRGVLEMQQHDFARAEPDLKKAVAADPSNRAALTELGKLDSMTGKLQESSTYLHQALQYPPVRWPTYYELAITDMFQHDYSGALAMSQNAERASPPAPATIHYLAGVAALHLGKPKLAAQELNTFLAQKGNDPQAQAQLASARKILQQIHAGQDPNATADRTVAAAPAR